MASIRMRNGTYQITVSCGYDVKGKKLLETTTFTPDPAMSPKKQEKAAKEFAVLFEQRVKTASPWTAASLRWKNLQAGGYRNMQKLTYSQEQCASTVRNYAIRSCRRWGT